MINFKISILLLLLISIFLLLSLLSRISFWFSRKMSVMMIMNEYIDRHWFMRLVFAVALLAFCFSGPFLIFDILQLAKYTYIKKQRMNKWCRFISEKSINFTYLDVEFASNDLFGSIIVTNDCDQCWIDDNVECFW